MTLIGKPSETGFGVAKRNGPKVTITLHCWDCAHHHDDPQHRNYHYCAHESFGREQFIGVGGPGGETPKWCPLRRERLEKVFRETIRRESR